MIYGGVTKILTINPNEENTDASINFGRNTLTQSNNIKPYLRHMTRLAILGFALFFLVSCQKQESLSPEEVEVGYEYYPIEIGKYITYQVDSILYDPTDGRIVRDSSSIQLRETITKSFQNFFRMYL